MTTSTRSSHRFDEARRTIAKEGEEITFPHGFPIAARSKEFTVAAACGGQDGQWGCVTHELAHRNNLSASIHEDEPGEHLVVWLCFMHGPEVP